MKIFKSIKFINSLAVAALFIVGAAIAAVVAGIPMKYTAGVGIGITLLASIAPQQSNIFSETIFRQIWTGETIKKMRLAEALTWISAIKLDYSQYVKTLNEEVQAINLASFPGLPDVLIDNDQYPIDSQDLPTDPLTINLNKYQTKQTTISDDELYANSTKLMANHIEAHTTSLLRNKVGKGAWNICPSNNNTATMPVLSATGGDDGTGRKMLTFDDLLAFKRLLDNNEDDNNPGSRILVLDTDHENDLCALDQKFKDQYFSYLTGKPYSMLNFTFYGSNLNPYYNVGNKQKLSFGGVVTNSHRKASMYFNTQRALIANGQTKVYLAPAAQNPGEQANKMNMRHYHLITRVMNEGVGAIISPNA